LDVAVKIGQIQISQLIKRPQRHASGYKMAGYMLKEDGIRSYIIGKSQWA
jgi:hypothetical protein